jgi:DNA-directed RNA polymerase specialized sigma24 family protein
MVLAIGQRLLQGTHAVEDVLQATFSTLARKGNSITKRESLVSWLYKVAYRIALRESPRSRTSRLRKAVGMPTQGSFGPARDLGWQELHDLLDGRE